MSLVQQLARRTHHRRFTEVLATYVLTKADQKVKAGTLYKELQTALANAGDKFRKLIDDNAPLFYVLDLHEVAEIIREELQQDVVEIQQSLRGYTAKFTIGGRAPEVFQQLNPAGSEQAVFNTDPEFYDLFSKTVLNETFTRSLAVQMLRELRKQLPAKKVTTAYTEAGGLKNLFDAYVAELADQATKGSQRSYYRFGQISIKYAKKFKSSIFGNTRLFRAEDASMLVPLKNKYTVVIVADSFTYGKERINKILEQAALEIFGKRGVISKEYNPKKPQESFKIGNFIDIGHTAAFTSNGQPIGVNMPGAQEVFIRLPSAAANKLEAELTGIYSELNLQVSLDQNFTEFGGDLLGIGTAFGVVMRKRVNSTLLRTVENRIIAQYRDQLEKSVSEVLESKEVRVALEELVPVNITRSPTAPEYVKDLLLSIFKGTKKPRLKKFSTENSTKTASTALNINAVSSKKFSGGTKSTNLATQKLNIKTSKVAPKKRTGIQSLINLEAILQKLNLELVDRIKRNMGTGNARDVLNYRTGRFANSVKVEKLNESRQGMITAFYSYMKNPYATFSQGGRQELPRSRDPKVLISKSIRELMQAQVANRMRAVSL